MKINDLYGKLSVRAIAYLKRLGYKDLKDIDLDKVNNSHIINFGLKTKAEITEFIEKKMEVVK